MCEKCNNTGVVYDPHTHIPEICICADLRINKMRSNKVTTNIIDFTYEIEKQKENENEKNKNEKENVGESNSW